MATFSQDIYTVYPYIIAVGLLAVVIAVAASRKRQRKLALFSLYLWVVLSGLYLLFSAAIAAFVSRASQIEHFFSSRHWYSAWFDYYTFAASVPSLRLLLVALLLALPLVLWRNREKPATQGKGHIRWYRRAALWGMTLAIGISPWVFGAAIRGITPQHEAAAITARGKRLHPHAQKTEPFKQYYGSRQETAESLERLFTGPAMFWHPVGMAAGMGLWQLKIQYLLAVTSFQKAGIALCFLLSIAIFFFSAVVFWKYFMEGLVGGTFNRPWIQMTIGLLGFFIFSESFEGLMAWTPQTFLHLAAVAIPVWLLFCRPSRRREAVWLWLSIAAINVVGILIVIFSTTSLGDQITILNLK